MAANREAVRRAVRAFDFDALFREELGWNAGAGQRSVQVGDQTYRLEVVAEKGDVPVLVHTAPAGQEIPGKAARAKILRQVRKHHLWSVAIFTDAAQTAQIWQWEIRQPGKPVRQREVPYYPGLKEEQLTQLLPGLDFPLELEEELGHLDVVARLEDASKNAEKVTKKFYDRFQKEHAAFLDFIEGIPDVADRRWYASLMLNRLMFVYFIQKKGFLANAPDYLRSRLELLQTQHGDGRFYGFYRTFLLRLFHEGLNAAKAERTSEIEALLGDVPYLNGGFFEEHQLEQAYPEIAIPDEAFAKIFAFFDEYRWHLDDRPLEHDNEINPDVLGYIFEKYVNQKQMGAYYTKEDITEYIGKNTILPWLFDDAKASCAIAFQPGSALWRLLQEDPDAYIYPAVRHGVDVTLPAEIAAGIDDVTKRGGWNRPAPAEIGLPTETWREAVARRQRYGGLWNRLVDGGVTAVDDLITLNLDVHLFAQDAIARCEGPELLRACWKALRRITVLDPTCGSGAFLFAALNLLEPLYEACLDRMQAFVSALDAAGEPHNSKKYQDFRDELARVAAHPNRRYFVLKSIMLDNLYGVDIMEEAVEICKLRLFLKLVAQIDRADQIEPLPDVDFNVRAGNTLVGFVDLKEVRNRLAGRMDFENLSAVIEEKAAKIADLANVFREQQTAHGGAISSSVKAVLRDRMHELAGTLDGLLAAEYGVTSEKHKQTFAQRMIVWREQYRPFHWFLEFRSIMDRGGFDAVVGNPPYVSWKKVGYLQAPSAAVRYTDLYASVVDRSLELMSLKRSRLGLIVPLSITFSGDFVELRKKVVASGSCWFSSYDILPSPLFNGAAQRCTIVFVKPEVVSRLSLGRLHRWRSIFRPHLFQVVSHSEAAVEGPSEYGLPRSFGDESARALEAIRIANKGAAKVAGLRGSPSIKFAKSALNFVSAFLENPPLLNESLHPIESERVNSVRLRDDQVANAALASLVGEAYLWYWLTRGDGFDVTGWVVGDYIGALSAISKEDLELLSRLGEQLHRRRFEALVFKHHARQWVGNFNYQPLFALTRRADLLFLLGLGVSPEDALAVLDWVQRTLSINVFAGEKAIPSEIKNRFPPLPVDGDAEANLLARVDSVLVHRYGIDPAVLNWLVSTDTRLRATDAALFEATEDSDESLGVAD